MSMLTPEMTEENHRRFIERVAESEALWGIRVANGFAYAESNAVDRGSHDVTPVLLFWSDRKYAARAQGDSYPEGRVELLTLFDFLFRCLPGMEADGTLAGTNWTGDLIGVELKPIALQEELLNAMGIARTTDYMTRLKESPRQGGQ
jgi:hypothetical protein